MRGGGGGSTFKGYSWVVLRGIKPRPSRALGLSRFPPLLLPPRALHQSLRSSCWHRRLRPRLSPKPVNTAPNNCQRNHVVSPHPPLGAKLITLPLQTYPQQPRTGEKSKLCAWAWIVPIFPLLNHHQERGRGGEERKKKAGGGGRGRWKDREVVFEEHFCQKA